MVDIGDYRQVEIDDKDLFMDHFSRYPPVHSDYTFSTMICWSDYMEYFYKFMDDSLLIMTRCGDEMFFRPPHGPRNREAALKIMDLSTEMNSATVFSVADPIMKQWLAEEFPDLNFEPHREYFDYVYLADDLASLPGKKYLKIRNYLNKFQKTYPHTVEEISKDDFSEVVDFMERWCEQRGCEEEPLLQSENIAMKKAIDLFFDLDLKGIVLRIGGEIEAVSIYEEMDRNTAVIHYEKANQDVRGLYQAINKEAARILAKKYRFINRESDMGLEGLRLAKEKYRPHHMTEVYHVMRQ
ncbi:MAG: DUF2156 domain-containing protein [Thermoplasmatota archaeon]